MPIAASRRAHARAGIALQPILAFVAKCGAFPQNELSAIVASVRARSSLEVLRQVDPHVIHPFDIGRCQIFAANGINRHEPRIGKRRSHKPIERSNLVSLSVKVLDCAERLCGSDPFDQPLAVAGSQWKVLIKPQAVRHD